ncbi:MAG: serine hydrolase [Rhodospirillaceae bacterium]|nr:serine hydrolase [Rhodospirillaceae bacterium]
MALLLTFLIGPAVAAEPEFRKDGLHAEAYGIEAGYPIGSRLTQGQQKFLVGSLSHYDEIFSARKIARPATAWPFRRENRLPDVRYNYQGGRYDLNEYLDRNPVTGLLIARDSMILFERYQYARTDAHRFTSQSMAKTITAMLIGIAVAEGKIKSIDDKAATYVPDLAGSAYGETPIRALLNMSSGVEFTERYDGKDDIAALSRGLFVPGTALSTTKVLAQFNNRTKPPGTVFHYAGSETLTLGLVLSAATGRPIAEYLSEKIWQPIGAEADASWVTDVFGHEVTYCCFNATLRDYARLGRLFARDGNWDGRQVIPRQWIKDATSVRAEDEHLRPGRVSQGFGYGYQVWLLGGEPAGTYSLRGIRGQVLFVDPVSRLIMVQTSARPQPVDAGMAENTALWRALVAQQRRD